MNLTSKVIQFQVVQHPDDSTPILYILTADGEMHVQFFDGKTWKWQPIIPFGSTTEGAENV